MSISETDIEQVKQSISLAAFIRARGVELKKKGRQLWGLCPFHVESEPSFAVDERKGLWNCLGRCNEGGDLYKFVMKADRCSFPAAHKKLMSEIGAPTKTAAKTPTPKETQSSANTEPKEKAELTKVELDWLERVTTHYHGCLLRNEKAVAYLKERGISSPEAITAFRLGFADGSLPEKLSAEGKAVLTKLGVLNENGNETMFGSLVFPLVDAHSKQTVNFYARHASRKQHLYLSGERRGLFNPAGATNTDELIITESIIDALALWSLGFRAVLPAYGTNGLTADILAHLVENRIGKVVLLLDADEAGREAVATMTIKLAELGIESRSVELPAKDAAEFVAKGGTAEQITELLTGKQSEELEPTPVETAPDLETLTDGTRLLKLATREYRVRGLSPIGLEKLKVHLRFSVGNLFHLDSIDLYQSRSRQTFAQMAAKLCRASESIINADLLLLVEKLEAARLEQRNKAESESTTAEAAAMTADEQAQALAFLKDEKLCERIASDFRACGLVGERSTVLTAYLAAVSRKLNDPLALLIVARSGAGKSALQDALCAFVPPEELVRVTRLTGQALFYKDPYSLQRKMLVIAEDEGAQAAVYSLRTLASDQRLSIAATRTDPTTGKLSTEHYEVFGPVVIVITTTSAEAFDEETRSRFVQLTMNESIEQTRLILEQQRRQHSLLGVLERAESETIRQLHHNAQRLLKPLAVVNPFVEHLTYPAEKLIHRREQRKYLSLINAIALLHQHQRLIKRAQRGETEIEYIEVELSDIALANELAGAVLSRALDELAPPVRGMYDELQKVCREKAESGKCKAEDVQMSRRDIRDATGWSDWQVRMYCQKLVEMEYLFAVQNSNGKPALYQLARAENTESMSLRGLTDIDELRRRLKENATT